MLKGRRYTNFQLYRSVSKSFIHEFITCLFMEEVDKHERLSNKYSRLQKQIIKGNGWEKGEKFSVSPEEAENFNYLLRRTKANTTK